MKAVRSSIEIAAPPSEVWDVLADFAGWAAWNDVMSEVRATPRIGGAISFRIQIDGLPALPIHAKIREWDETRALAWGGGVRHLVTGHHFMRLEPIAETKTWVSHGEDFHGLVPLLAMRPILIRRIERTYERFNRQLKERVEGRAPRA